ncbi:uncharacterized protein PF3D7_1120000 [Anabrus simplex]|uniref:uncharacterized protein PF3D7_1120000 n=1 Tax=Anabrus simplex TaxID=316456 RepID=UPI0035A2C428
MDLKVEIKEEPICLEEKENFELVSEIRPVKEETKSELTEAWSRQENAFEPCADNKEEISLGQDSVDELVPRVKEENKNEERHIINLKEDRISEN